MEPVFEVGHFGSLIDEVEDHLQVCFFSGLEALRIVQYEAIVSWPCERGVDIMDASFSVLDFLVERRVSIPQRWIRRWLTVTWAPIPKTRLIRADFPTPDYSSSLIRTLESLRTARDGAYVSYDQDPKPARTRENKVRLSWISDSQSRGCHTWDTG